MGGDSSGSQADHKADSIHSLVTSVRTSSLSDFSLPGQATSISKRVISIWLRVFHLSVSKGILPPRSLPSPSSHFSLKHRRTARFSFENLTYLCSHLFQLIDTLTISFTVSTERVTRCCLQFVLLSYCSQYRQFLQPSASFL